MSKINNVLGLVVFTAVGLSGCGGDGLDVPKGTQLYKCQMDINSGRTNLVSETYWIGVRDEPMTDQIRSEIFRGVAIERVRNRHGESWDWNPPENEIVEEQSRLERAYAIAPDDERFERMYALSRENVISFDLYRERTDARLTHRSVSITPRSEFSGNQLLKLELEINNDAAREEAYELDLSPPARDRVSFDLVLRYDNWRYNGEDSFEVRSYVSAISKPDCRGAFGFVARYPEGRISAKIGESFVVTATGAPGAVDSIDWSEDDYTSAELAACARYTAKFSCKAK